MDYSKSCGCDCTPDAGSPAGYCTGNPDNISDIRETTGTITLHNRFDHFLARWGVNRLDHIIEPGLYRLGNPTPESPVFASANYTLSFNALRSALSTTDAWILVLNTKGINVWCAAGKGTFGTEELIRRIRLTDLASIVKHRKIIVPQLGAPGISWPHVLRESGFKVEYGPVRASDLPAYLQDHKATPAMRRVQFTVWDRIVLIPVEFVHALPITIISVLAIGFLANWTLAIQLLTAILAGNVLFPILLPILPTKDFTTKGLVLGMIVMLPFAILPNAITVSGFPGIAEAYAITSFLIFPPITAYIALNFTGCTTFTSRTGVRTEIFSYIRLLVGMPIAGLLLTGMFFLIASGVI